MVRLMELVQELVEVGFVVEAQKMERLQPSQRQALKFLLQMGWVATEHEVQSLLVVESWKTAE